jgi:hypothetical protein
VGGVVELFNTDDNGSPHLSGEAKCNDCGKRWIACAPVGTVFFECPACSSGRGTLVYPVEMGGYRWKCNCHNNLFHITPDGVYCPMCGSWQEGY